MERWNCRASESQPENKLGRPANQEQRYWSGVGLATEFKARFSDLQPALHYDRTAHLLRACLLALLYSTPMSSQPGEANQDPKVQQKSKHSTGSNHRVVLESITPHGTTLLVLESITPNGTTLSHDMSIMLLPRLGLATAFLFVAGHTL